MDIVKMERNCLGDTRTATHMPTREEFREANWSHKDDVLNLAVAFATELRSRVGNHDWTKVQAPYDEMFYELMRSTIEDGADFMDGEWARLHYDVLERHHLSRHCPSDVTLFDVLEMLFDCVSAGMTRSGSVYPIEISNEILQRAIGNTVDYLVKHIEVADRKTEPFDKDINVRSKDEPQTNADQHVQRVESVKSVDHKDEPQTCSVNGRSYSECADCEYFRCTADEPQTDKELRTLDEMLTNLEIWSTWNKTFANEMIGICSKMRNLLADRKDEPKTNADQHVQRIEYVGNDGRCRCWKCKHFKRIHATPISSDGKYYTYVVCMASECHYEPKVEQSGKE